MDELRLVPEMDVLGSKEVDVLTIEASGHHEVVADLVRKKRHALVLDAPTVERDHVEVAKIRRFDELRQDPEAVVSGIRGVVGHVAVGMGEAHESGILDAAALVLAHWKDHALGDRSVGRKIEVVVRAG